MVFPTLRTEHYEKDTLDAQLRENLDLLEERRAEEHLRELTYKKAIARLYNSKVHPQQVTTGDLVLRKTQLELGVNWHRPGRVRTESSKWSEKALTSLQT
ncbi:hypothetical protein BHM03_00011814 [Ensete ventricosum]|uniref:Uncharacterized protein n=1 Tax=Ensete ventricosum TaxID=4639 RepID=A0A445MDH8_ENSVE|nr:hypothetical protein BHM03_00011814 [Ensete ventricosum]